MNILRVKGKVLSEQHGLQGSANHGCCGPQLDTSQSCRTMDMGTMHRMVCLFTSHYTPLRNYTSCHTWQCSGWGLNPQSPVASPVPTPLCHWATKKNIPHHKYIFTLLYL